VRSYTRVYTESGTVVHALDDLHSPNQPTEALCGRTPWPGLWLGTGSQDEEDRALELSPCTRCLSIIRYHSVGMETPEGWETR
jgi:hypothetical protein